MFIRSTERTNVILGVFKEFPRNPLPTLKQLMDHLLGHNRKAELDKSLRMDQYGIGRDRRLRFIDIEYLLMRALMDSLLKEILVPCETPRGYCSYAYLEVRGIGDVSVNSISNNISSLMRRVGIC